MAKKIEIIIDNEGKIMFDFSGYPKKSCQTEMSRIEAMLKTAGFKSSNVHYKDKPDNKEREINNERKTASN